MMAGSMQPAPNRNQRKYVPRCGSPIFGARPAAWNSSARYMQMAAVSVTTTPRCTMAGTLPIGLIAR